MFKNSSVVEKLLRDRYYTEHESSWEQIAQRVSRYVASAGVVRGEDTLTDIKTNEAIFYDAIMRRYIIPNSPTLFSAGFNTSVSLLYKDISEMSLSDYQEIYDSRRSNGSLSACFVLGIEDSMESIYTALREMALVTQSGGGVGFDFSKLRPKGCAVNGAGGVSSGPLSFMKVFDVSADAIKQGGKRRAALMGILDYDHPDAMDFISAKKDNDGKSVLSYFNISLDINPDEFIRLLDEDGDVVFTHEKSGDIGTINAREYLHMIAENAWKTGDPGIVFTSRHNEYSAYSNTMPCDATNPCQPAFATVLTPSGIRQFKDIDTGSVIWSGNAWTTVARKLRTGTKDVYVYGTTSGRFVGTENHRVVTKHGKLNVSEAHEILVGGGVCSLASELDPQDVMDGLVIGDGSVHAASNNKVVLYIGENDLSYFDSEISDLLNNFPGIHVYDREKGTGAWTITTTVRADELPRTYNRTIPERFYQGDEKKVRGFLRGLYSANGCSIYRGDRIARVSLKASSLSIIEMAQDMLSSIGIRSYYTTNKSTTVKHHNGTYTGRQSYDLNISTDRGIFFAKVGFIQPYKYGELGGVLNGDKYATIVSRELLGKFDVYDITVDSPEHTYWTGGLIVSNCGEQFLMSNGSCNLMAIDIAKCGSIPEINRYARIATRFLDHIIDINSFPLKQIADTNLRYRDIGLGVMGVHDYLIDKDLQYGSETGRLEIARVMANITNTAYLISSGMAQKYGAAPVFSGSRFITENLFSPIRMLDHNSMADINSKLRMTFDIVRRNGLRNMSVTTIAPTGSTSLISECSSGIEPVFLFAHRRTMVSKSGEDAVLNMAHLSIPEQYIDRVLDGESLYDLTGDGKYRSAQEIAPEDHLMMQAYAQAYVTNSISKTINLPNSATVEDIERIYKLAMRGGVKGLTVYRDQSLMWQPLAKPEKKEIAFTLMPERDKELSGYTRVHNDGGRKTYVTVNFNDDVEPVEVFINGDSRVSELIGRMVSMALRHGVTPEKVVNQLIKTGGYAAEIGEILYKMMVNAYEDRPLIEYEWEKTSYGFSVNSRGDIKCPSCGGINTIHMTESCVLCSSCGYSLCNA